VDYQALLYGPAYGVLGVAAVLHMGDPLGDVPITAIDKTAGLALNQAVDVQTVLPAATVRAPDLAAAGIALEDLDGKILTLNGKDWRVASLHPKPSPNGEGDGEIYLILDASVY
jgi:hypothetical protein